MRSEASLIRLSLVGRAQSQRIRAIRNSFVGKGIYPEDRLIGETEHQTWFAGLDAAKDRFCLVRSAADDRELGMIGCIQTGRPAGSGEISIYIVDESCSLLVPVQAMTLLLMHAFDDLTLNRVFGSFFKNNTRALRFNASFGFQRFHETETVVQTELKADAYRALKDKWTPFLART